MNYDKTTSAGPARLSRTAGGGTKHQGASYAIGECDRGVSGTPIAATNGAGSPAWNNVKKSKNRMGSPHTANPKNRWEHRSHNPSGASNIPDLGRGGEFGDYDD